MEKMDKINIYVPRNIGRMLENDAIQFEVFKKDGYTVNKNKFLTMLIQGYYESYMKQARATFNKVYEILATSQLSEEENSRLANEILLKIILPEVPARKGKNPIKLSLKPTKETIPLIKRIMMDLGAADYISQFFCRMLMSYCQKHISEREQILFKENYDFISKACEEQYSIRFSTIWNAKDIHEVIPYKIVTGNEEMFTYLLCGERNKWTGIMEAKSYRLNRIYLPGYGSVREPLSDEVERYLNRMLHYAPQFAINDNEISCVRLTEEGRKYFNRVYYGRPKVEEIVKGETGWLYYFNCSKEQLYQYFKKFENNRAEIVEPQDLKLRIKRFHEQALQADRKDVDYEN